MRHVVVQTWLVLDDSPDIPRLVTRSSRMVRPPFRAVQALWNVEPPSRLLVGNAAHQMSLSHSTRGPIALWDDPVV